MFWKKLIFLNSALFVISLQILSLYLKNKEYTEERVIKLISYFKV